MNLKYILKFLIVSSYILIVLSLIAIVLLSDCYIPGKVLLTGLITLIASCITVVIVAEDNSDISTS